MLPCPGISTEPEPEQESTSTDEYALLDVVHSLVEPSNPGFFNTFQELCVRHLQAPLPSQNLLLPQGVLFEALLPSQTPFD